MSVLTKAQIKKAEENAVLNGTFSFKDLMFTAGSLVAKKITENFEVENKDIAVLVGKGNNGGDGCVIADLLSKSGANVTVITPLGPPVTENAKYYYDNLRVNITSQIEKDFDIIIDALFGFGFQGKLDDNIKELIETANKQKGLKIAVDIPSGAVCDNGKVDSVAFMADYTFTFIALKPCFMLPDGSNYCGKVEVLDIGVEATEYTYQTIKEPTFKKRLHNSHKGTYGTALLICGSYGMAGALMMAAKSALRSGLGIVKCIIPKSIYIPFTRFLPEAVCLPFKETRKGTIKFNLKFFKKHINSADSVLFGPGIGKHKENLKILKFLLKTDKPLVIDADGINALSERIDLLRQCKAPLILTPHPAEMSRLCKVPVSEIEANRPKLASKFAKEYGCTLVLKGSNTIVADSQGNVFFNVIGNNGMATGGSGDVLAGIVASYLAQGYSPIDAAKFAVYIHSFAADKAVLKRSRHALLPTDIIEEL